jgi:hypothetical protein
VRVKSPSAAVITVDGQAARANEDLALCPGQHLVEVQEGDAPRRIEIDLGPGHRLSILPEAPPAREAVMLGSFAVGALGVVGVLLTASAISTRKTTVAAHCDAAARCDSQGKSAAEQGKSLSRLNILSWAVALGGGGGGVALLLTAPRVIEDLPPGPQPRPGVIGLGLSLQGAL